MRTKRVKRIVLITAASLVVTAGGATAWALDRFVVDHVEISDVAAYEAAASASVASRAASSNSSVAESTAESTAGGATGGSSGSTAADTAATTTESSSSTAAPTVTATSYTSGSTAISISKVVTGSGDSTVTYYVADVRLSEATAVRGAFANNEFGENIVEDTSAMARDHNAIFAINGDYYGFRDDGIVIRNGVVYRDSGARQGLAFYTDGTVKVYDETTTTAQQLVDDGVWNTLSFGPALLENGEIVDGIDNVEVDTNFGNHSIQGDQPRTAVGVIDSNHLVFVVVDGRSTGYSAGVTMTELAQIMQSLGATTAYNIDGGGSSTMYFNGSLVNDPLGRGQERGTSDILYIADGA